MDKNARERNKREAHINQNIVSSGKIKICNKSLDISDKLKMYSSKEYRKNDIDKIKVTDFNKAGTECQYTMLIDGSDTVAFNKRYEQKKICILNFASSKNPGGGFETGAMAQEEALCQASNLYNVLIEHYDFYDYNNRNINKCLYSDGIIFSENVLFFRNKYKNVEPRFVNIITCAAPNRGAALRNSVSEKEIECTMSRRIEQILKVAIANNVRILALGAFGCGVFRNEPEKVASIMATLLKTKGLGDYFEEIIFPMNESMGRNVEAFKNYF